MKAYAAVIGMIGVFVAGACGSSDPADRLLEAKMKYEAAQVAYGVARYEGGFDESELKREAEILAAEYEYLLSKADADTRALADIRYAQVFPWGGYESAQVLMDSVEDIVRGARARVSEAEAEVRDAELETSSLRDELAEVVRLPRRLQSENDRLAVENTSLEREIARLQRVVARKEEVVKRVTEANQTYRFCELDESLFFSSQVKRLRAEVCP